MQRALEAIFSHWLQLLALLFVPLVIAMGIVMTQQRQYEGGATIWALERYTVVGATGPESDLSATPASTQATAISEILQTKAFALAIGREANLPATYAKSVQSNPEQVDSTMYTDISTHVIATAVSYNLVTIIYDNPIPDVAKRVVQATLDQYALTAPQLATNESTQLLLIYQQQLQQARDAANKAVAAAATYLRDHPGATIQTDPQYNTLENNAVSAQAAVNDVQSTIDKINQNVATIKTPTTLYSVVDAPAVGTHPVSRTKVLLTGGAIGLVVGLLACIIFIVILMRRDRSIYSVADLQKITDVPVLLQIPQMPPRILAQSVERLEAGGRYI